MTLIAWATSKIGVHGFVVNVNLGIRHWRRQMPTSWSVNEFDRARIKPTSLSVESFQQGDGEIEWLEHREFWQSCTRE